MSVSHITYVCAFAHVTQVIYIRGVFRARALANIYRCGGMRAQQISQLIRVHVLVDGVAYTLWVCTIITLTFHWQRAGKRRRSAVCDTADA